MFHHGQLVKVHPRQRPAVGGPTLNDLPTERVGHAMDQDRLTATAAGHGRKVGIYAARLLDNPLRVPVTFPTNQ